MNIKDIIKQTQTGKSNGSMTNVIFGATSGLGVINVIEVIICGFKKWTASNLFSVTVSAPKPISANCEKFIFLEFNKQLLFYKKYLRIYFSYNSRPGIIW